MRGLIEKIVDLEAEEIALVAPALGGALVAMGINVVPSDSNWPLGVHVYDPLSHQMTPELSLEPFEIGFSAEVATKFVLVDDVSHTGKTLLDCLGLFSGSPERVLGVFSVVDRGFGARRRLAEQGHELHSLFTLDEIESHFRSSPHFDAR